MKSKRKIFLILLTLIALLTMLDIYISSHVLQTDVYKIKTNRISEDIRLVLISDLHGNQFGTDNQKLIEKISANEPDIICIPGDLLDKNSEESYQLALVTIQSLSKICPVYISIGNHELDYAYSSLSEIKKDFKDAGAIVIDESYLDVEVNENKIRIGGFFGYGAPDDNIDSTNSNTLFLRDFQNTDRYKICLCHMPLEWYLEDRSLDYWNIDLVLCGHTHGGQIRIPFIGGMYAPDLGYFPGREKGIYDSEDGTKHMILTTGLGSTESIPRFNNPPEIVVVNLQPRE